MLMDIIAVFGHSMENLELLLVSLYCYTYSLVSSDSFDSC